MAMGLPVLGEGWCRIEMGEEVLPHGVEMSRFATGVKPGSCWSPVPPMTAMGTCSGEFSASVEEY